MATKETTIAYILDQLSGLKSMRARKMFGGYVVYYQNQGMALACYDELFVKTTEPGKKFAAGKYTEGFPYPGAKAAMHISGDLLEDGKFMCELIRVTAQALPAAKLKK
jgi:TfoX/Sxy family transcriptional regulator of competence genes